MRAILVLAVLVCVGCGGGGGGPSGGRSFSADFPITESSVPLAWNHGHVTLPGLFASLTVGGRGVSTLYSGNSVQLSLHCEVGGLDDGDPCPILTGRTIDVVPAADGPNGGASLQDYSAASWRESHLGFRIDSGTMQIGEFLCSTGSGGPHGRITSAIITLNLSITGDFYNGAFPQDPADIGRFHDATGSATATITISPVAGESKVEIRGVIFEAP